MDNSFIFTIVLSINNFTFYSLKILDSIINNQTLNFKENVQLIIINYEENITSSLSEYASVFPDNITIISNIQSNDFYNNISNYSAGKYLLFMEDNVILSNNALSNVNDLFESYDTDVVFLLNKEFMDKKYSLNDDNFFELNDRNTLIPLDNAMYFINRNVFEEVFSSSINNDLWGIVLKIIDIKRYYCIVNESSYLIQYIDGNKKDVDNNEFHLLKLTNFYMELVDYFCIKYSKIPKYVQEVFVYQLSNLIEEVNVDLLNHGDKESFFNVLNKIIVQLDFNTILSYWYVDSRKKNFLLYLHNNHSILLENDNEQLNLKIKDYIVDNLNRHKIWLDIVDINDDVLNIAGLLQSNFSNEDISIRLVSQKNSNKKIYDCTLSDYKQDERKNISYLSIDWIYRYNFNFEISLKELIDSKLYFEVCYDDGVVLFSYLPEIAFRVPASLSTSSIYSTNENYILYFKENSFNIQRNAYSLLLKLEFSNLKKIFKDKREGYIFALFLRIIYVILYPLMHKRNIWLFNDRLSYADDNAIALYDYSVKQFDDNDKYFVISENSFDYDNLKGNYPNIIKFGSFKHKLLYLFANKVISSFVNEDYSNPFHIPGYLEYKQLYSGLFSFKRYFLQHGVTLGDYSNSIKRYNINLSLIVTSNMLEAQSYKNPSYGYDEDIIQILGLPRYDKLNKKTTKKQIVYMPTWRSYLNHDEFLFKYSKFYKTISDLLTSHELNHLLERYGYEFVFKPHPELYKYLDYFSLDHVILSDESYRSLFNKSAILITDYSSVAFDFAYLKKPVIYYQNSDDYHYKEGYFDFHSMGFGEIIPDESELINKIEKYIKNDCIMEEKYQKRVEEFFSFHDKNNCQRVYSWINNN